jgi:hypothetical protein
MILNKKKIKNAISNKKINNLKNFAILFNPKKNNLHVTRITRTQFLNLNRNVFSDKILPANIYFFEYKNLDELIAVRENIIIVKYNNNYFFENQIDSLFLNNNLTRITNNLGFYKKFYFILKTISLKK